MKNFTAPQMDNYIRIFEVDSLNPISYDKKVKEKIKELYAELDLIEPIENSDDVKILYFSLPRGEIEDYGDYKELKELGEVKSYEQFKNNYKEDYPDETYWYKIVTSKYENFRTISINHKTIICADMFQEQKYEIELLSEFLDLIISEAKECITMLKNDTYNDYIEKNLSFRNKFGVIKRSLFWKVGI